MGRRVEIITSASEAELAESFARPDIGHVFVIAPNYEERSLGATELLDRCLPKSSEQRVGVFQITLQSTRPRDVLDRIKSSNRRYSEQQLRSRTNFMAEPATIPMGQASFVPMMAKIRRLCRDSGDQVRLYIDISALPRTILLGMLDDLLGAWSPTIGGVAVGRTSRITSIFFIYTPARRYPPKHSDDTLGVIRGRYSHAPLHELLSEQVSRVELCLFLAGNSHDAAQTLGALPQRGGPADGVGLHAFMYFSPDNALLSYSKFGDNLWSIRELRARSVQLTYTFGITHTADLLGRYAQNAAHDHLQRDDENAWFLIGGFGPKPVGLCSYLAKKRYDSIVGKSGILNQSDVLVVDGSQYTSLYSIDSGPARVYHIDVETVLSI
ncbi:hypothetical protein [Nocardia amamiensis]|uniref:hypothetical protein n=1 Tax=Nocardia amamiensis TaxID=404578 RepID=UPI0033F73DA6